MPSPDPSPSFTWNAADYHKSSPAQHHWAQELIAKLGLSGTSRVLDIGCGDGKITAEIARNLAEGSVTGMDSSPPPSSPSDITDVILSQTTLYISVDTGFYWNTIKFPNPAKSPYLSQVTYHPTDQMTRLRDP